MLPSVASDQFVPAHKLAPPGLPPAPVARARVHEEYRSRFAEARCLAVVAAAGAGKTTQAQLFAAESGHPLAWLSLDRSDGSAPRLLAGLAAALDTGTGAGARAVRDALRSDHSPEEAATLLAGELLPGSKLLVLDDCNHVYSSREASSALEAFLSYSPAGLRVMLLSRDDVAWPLCRRLIEGSMAVVSEAVLNFTQEETRDLTGALPGETEGADALHAATGGWVAGVVLGSRPDLGSVSGTRKIGDFGAHLGRQLLQRLSQEERQFLLDTSVATVVTRDVAAALCGTDGHRLWDWLSTAHLPATTSTGTTVTYHALFRSFLHEQLAARTPDRYPMLVRRYASYLAAAGRLEEATELLLGIDDHPAAAQSAIRAVQSRYDTADWPTLYRWTEALGPQIVQDHPLLVAARIRALHGTRRFEQVTSLIRALDQHGRLREATEADPGLLATVAWAMQADTAEAKRLLRKYRGDYRAEAVKFMIDVSSGLTPAAPVVGAGWADVERHITWAFVLQGRLGELERFVPADQDTPIINPNVILAPVLRGRQLEARSLWNAVPPELRGRPQSRLIESWMLVSEGRLADALAAVQLAVVDSRSTHFSLTSVYEVFTAYVLARLDRVDDATTLLEGIIGGLSGRGETAMLEWAQAILGLACLRQDRTQEARLILREAVRSMRAAQRRLFLPVAAACLSEAAHRLGDSEEAREAAELAYHSASLIGSFSGLLDVIRMFPSILARESSRDPADTRWRLLASVSPGRSGLPVRSAGHGKIYLSVQPFGQDRDIYVDGLRQHAGRLKIVELAAYLALHPRGTDRSELQRQLFPEADPRSGGNHFRQITHKFAQATGVALVRQEPNLLVVPDGVWVDSVDVRFERLVRSTGLIPGHERVSGLREALELIRGGYLITSTLPWAEDRRQQIEIMEEEARLELVSLLIEQGDPATARQECEALLAVNKYCDAAYRLLVEIERAVGSESSCLAAYRRAVRALQELGLQPADARRLLGMSPPMRPEHAGAAGPRDRSGRQLTPRRHAIRNGAA